MQIVVKTLSGREIILNVEGTEEELEEMKVKIDNSRVKVRPAPGVVNRGGKSIRKDFGSREKHAAGGGLSKSAAKKVMAMQRGSLESKVVQKKLPTRSRVNRHKTMN